MCVWVIQGAVHPRAPFSPALYFWHPLVSHCASRIHLQNMNAHTPPVLVQSELIHAGHHWAKSNHPLAMASKTTLDPSQSSELTFFLQWCYMYPAEARELFLTAEAEAAPIQRGCFAVWVALKSSFWIAAVVSQRINCLYSVFTRVELWAFVI